MKELVEPEWLAQINAMLAAAVAEVDPALWTYGYVRISQDEKGKAEGVETQTKNELGYARRNGLYLAHVFCDNDISGKKAVRPALSKLLELIDNGPSKHILSRDVARLTRNRRLGMDLLDRGENEGVRYVFMDESDLDLTTPSGREDFAARVNKAAGRVEADTELMRTRMRDNAAMGRRQGGSRQFGYGKVAGVHPVTGAEVFDPYAVREDEAAILREARDRIVNGENQTAIVQDFSRRGVTTATGAQWRVGKLSKVLTLESYVIYDLGEHTSAETGLRCECLDNPEGGAIRVHSTTGTRHRAKWPGIFTRADHDAIRVGIKAHYKGKDPDRPRARNGEYWMTGLAECGGRWPERTERAGQRCGSAMVGSLLMRRRKTGDAVVERRYVCRAKDARKVACGCGRVFRAAGGLEMYVAEHIIAAYEDPDIVARLDRGNVNAGRIVELERRIEVTTGNLDSETDKRTAILTGGADEYDLRVIDRTITGMKQTLKTLRTEQDSLRTAQARAVLEDMAAAGGPRKAWNAKGAKWRHEAAARLVEKVIIKPARIYAARWTDQNGKAWRFDETSVEIVWREL